MNPQQRTGLTPLVLRLAAKYVALGIGTYDCTSLGYEEVKVTVLRKWGNYALRGEEPIYLQEMQVSFYRGGKRERWVDFSMRFSGGGGPPMVSMIPGGQDGEEGNGENRGAEGDGGETQ